MARRSLLLALDNGIVRSGAGGGGGAARLAGDFGFLSGGSDVPVGGGVFVDLSIDWVAGTASDAQFKHVGSGVIRYTGPTGKFEIELLVAGFGKGILDNRNILLAVSKNPGSADQRPSIGTLFLDGGPQVSQIQTHLVDTLASGDLLVGRVQAKDPGYSFSINTASLTITPV